MFGSGSGEGNGRVQPTLADNLRFAMLAEVRGYWEGLRCGDRPPSRSEVDPRGLAGALENSFVIERVAPGIARFRIAGMHLGEIMGMDVRGMPVLSLIDPPARATFRVALEAVFAGPSILEMALEAERGIGRPRLEARLLLLPLRDRTGATALALGCLATDGKIGRAPRRLAIAQHRLTALTPKPAYEMADAGIPFLRAAKPIPGQPHLRLVKG
jgi:hypothetical protein